MTEKQKISIKKYREKNKNNPEYRKRLKEQRQKYYLKNKEKLAKYSKEYWKNPEVKEKNKIYSKEYMQNYRKLNSKRINEKRRAYYQLNKNKINSQKRARRKLLKQLKENK
ncbi:hypothetical protein [Spiroplasma endosymbiont of Lariophagus distinguendus]|uniref:hypothetical protein n=1 Tax=Spiroplasma endosymbiont of Lariophagus distinguendus TaxID=2935082 RepID=UPI002079E1EF|nr:hypothetical protein [Spiroplasma endosymbiont of Lariophagus distinguendus]